MRSLHIIRKFFLLALLVASVLTGCALLNMNSQGEYPPFLSLEELNSRPYARLGRIQVTREAYGTDSVLMPDIKAWGMEAIRQEAEKMGADAIIQPEVTGRTTSYGLLPSTEYRASGVAIKFK
ncbi:MAG TPA: hypothetical protein HPP94_08295 [Desulfuromonadales bacterium]|nr:hypothetical protein [Desulfuromonadales bacterium]